MPTEARPAFLAITGQIEHDTLAASLRFAACLRDVSGAVESDAALVAASTLAARAFGGEGDAWAPLVAAVQRLLIAGSDGPDRAAKSRCELHAFVAENVDLLER